jgi:hypothetical protein
VQGFQAPLAEGELGDRGGVGLDGGEVGDAQDGDVGQGLAMEVGDLAFDQENLVDVGKFSARVRKGLAWCGW